MKTITGNELWSSIQAKEEMTIVEALSQKEFDEGHIEGAIRISKDEVEALAPKLLTDKNARIVVYCADVTCNASPGVVGKLTNLGYTNVSDYKEGKKDWIAAGHPVVTAATSTKG